MLERQIAPTARLAYVVVQMQGQVEREQHVAPAKKGDPIQTKMVKEDAGFIVYFPKGHVIRVRTEAELKHHGLDKAPRLIDMEGLTDPNSALGSMFMRQNEQDRAANYEALEDRVIALATAKSGKIIMPEMIKQTSDVSTDIVRPSVERGQHTAAPRRSTRMKQTEAA